MIKHDYHLHTSFSSDSDTPMKDMIEKAISLGLSTICFTEHFDYDFPENPAGLDFLLDFEEYKKAVSSYKKEYASKIEILHGIEVGVQPHIKEALDTFYQNYGSSYDFILASCHTVYGLDPYEPEFFAAYPGKEGVSKYFEALLSNMNVFTHYQSLAHLDYAYRYYPAPRPDFSYSLYGDLIDEILKIAIAQGKAIEVNTSGLRSGLPFANPHIDILKRYRQLGGEMITIGSDAHKTRDIAASFDQMKDYLLSAGFEYYTVFKNQKPSFISL